MEPGTSEYSIVDELLGEQRSVLEAEFRRERWVWMLVLLSCTVFWLALYVGKSTTIRCEEQRRVMWRT